MKYFVKMLVTCTLYYYAGPGCLINCCKLRCFLSRVSYLSLSGLARDRCSFLVESRKSVLDRRSYVSCINFIELFVLPVCTFWNCKCRCSRASLWTFLRVVYDIVWFYSGKSSEFRSSSYDCSSSSTLWLSLLLFAMLSV